MWKNSYIKFYSLGDPTKLRMCRRGSTTLLRSSDTLIWSPLSTVYKIHVVDRFRGHFHSDSGVQTNWSQKIKKDAVCIGKGIASSVRDADDGGVGNRMYSAREQGWCR